MARLEGAYEQVDRRLAAMDGRLETLDRKIDVKIDSLESKLTAKLDALDGKFDRKFDTLTGEFTKRLDAAQWRTTWLIVTTWVTLMLTLFFHKT